MQDLSQVMGALIQRNVAASQPTDLRIGTVVSADPLQISINTEMAPLEKGVLLLTQNVIEKKIPVLQHNHSYTEGATGNALTSIACYENGTALPVKDGYIILNRGLEVGDKVLLLRVSSGQRFIILSRVV